MVLPPYDQLDWSTYKASGIELSSNQAVTGNFDSPSPGLFSQYNSVSAVFVSAIPSMYLWYRLINRLGTLKCWRIALAWLGLSLVPMYFVHSLLPACLAGVLVGVGIAGVTANLDMVNSVLIEDDAARYGVRREATFFAGISFITRLSSLTRSGVFLLLFTLFGFESGESPGAMPGTAARFMMIVFPIALMAFSVCASLLVRFRAPAARAAKPAAKL